MATHNTTSLTDINKKYLDIYNFFVKSNIYNTTEETKSYCLDLISVLQALKILYNGIGGDSKQALENELDFKDIIKTIPVAMYMRAGVFTRKIYPLNKKFHYSYGRHIYLSNIPTDNSQMKYINDKIEKKFNSWPIENDPFLTRFFPEDCNLYIKTETLFNSYWQKPFDKCATKRDYFHIGDNKRILVPMMKNSGIERLLTYHHYHDNDDKLRNCLFASIPYENNIYKMLIIMPDRACGQKELLHICANELTSDDITKFYTSLGTMKLYTDKILPKFEFETRWNISNNSIDNSSNNCYYPYINRLLNKDNNFGNISLYFSNGINFIELESTTKIINYEKGTFIKSETEVYEPDYHYSSSEMLPPLEINKGFIYIIVNKSNIICSMGIYTGSNVTLSP